MSEKTLFFILISALLLGYVFIFTSRNSFTRKYQDFKAKAVMATDLSYFFVNFKNKRLRYLERLKKEQEQKEVEERMKSGINTYPTHTTKKEWIEKEYHVGEEKESFFPEHQEKDHKSNDA